MERLVREVRKVQQVLSEPFDEWEVCARALDDLAYAVESLGLDESKKEAVRQLMPIADLLGGQITGLRSKLVIECCRHIIRIVKATQRDFKELANALLLSLAASAKGSSRAIRQPGADLFSFISQYVRYDLHVFSRIYVTAQHEKVRILLLEQLEMILVYWSMNDLEPYFADAVGIVRKGLQDSSQQVRKTCRGTFCMVSSKWPDRVDELIGITTSQTRDILVKEKPTAEIVKAMMTKFPELEKKKSNMAAPSTKSFAQQRSLLRRNPSSVSDQEDEVQIHVPTKQSFMATIETPPSEPRNDIPDNGDRLAIKHQLAHTSSSQSTERYSGNSHTRVNAVKDEATLEMISQQRNGNIDSTDKSDHPTFVATPPRARPDEVFRRSRIDMRSEGSKIPLPSDRSPIVRRSTEFSSMRTHETVGEFRSSIPKPRGRSLFSSTNSNIVTEKDKVYDSLGDSLERPFQMSEDFSPSPSLQSNVTVREKRRPVLDPLPATPVPSSSNFDEEPPTATLQSPFFSADHCEQSQQEIGFVKMNDEVLLKKSETSEAVDEHDGINDDIDETMLIERKVQNTSLEFMDREKHVAVSPHSFAEPSVEELLENVRQLQLKLNVIKNVSDQKEMGIPFKHRSMKKKDAVETVNYEASFTKPLCGAVPRSVPNSLDRAENSNMFASFMLEESHEQDPLEEREYSHEFGSEAMMSQEKEVQAYRSDVPASQSNERHPYRYEFGDTSPTPQPKGQQAFDAEVKAPQRKEPALRHDFEAAVVATEHQTHPHRVEAAVTAFEPKEEQRAYRHEFYTASASVAKENVIFTEPHTLYSGMQEERAKPKIDSIFTGADFTVDRHMMRRRDDRLGLETAECKDTASLYVPTEENLQRRGGQLFRREEVTTSSLELKRPSNQPTRQRGVQSEIVARHQVDENDFWEKAHQYASNEDRKLFSAVEHNADPIRSKSRKAEQDVTLVQFENEHRGTERRSKPFEDVPETPLPPAPENLQPALRDTLPNEEISVPHVAELSLKTAGWTKTMLFYFIISLGLIFGASGLLRAITTIRDSHAYHHALLSRIGKFETSIAESYKAVRKLEDNYVVWSEYVRKLAQEDEASALLQLETIQREVEKWQVEMKEDLEEFKLSLAIDLADAAFASPEANTTGGN